MKNRSALLGLLIYSFQSVRGSLIFILLLSIFIGAVGLVSGFSPLLNAFPFLAGGGVPYAILAKRYEDTSKWEQYQISMPIKRKTLATSLFLSVFISALLGVPILGAFWGIGSIFNSIGRAEFNLYGGLGSIALTYGFVLLFAALFYPMLCTSLGKRNKQGLFLACMLIATAIVTTIFITVDIATSLTFSGILLLMIAITGLAFIISLLITREIYAKMDF